MKVRNFGLPYSKVYTYRQTDFSPERKIMAGEINISICSTPIDTQRTTVIIFRREELPQLIAILQEIESEKL